MRRLFLFAFYACLLSAVLPAQSRTLAQPAQGQPDRAYLSDPKYNSILEAARQSEHKHQYNDALDGYKKASKIAGGTSYTCLQKIYELEYQTSDFKAALKTTDQMQSLAVTPREKSLAAGERGAALLSQAGDKPKPAQLDAAHEAFQMALAANAENNSARFHDACVLARMGKTDDAGKQFARCADAASPSDPMRVRARHFAENPLLSLEKMAPAFEVTALDGSRFNLDTMQGHVVLIDFWATWCGPCNRELPHLKQITREFADQPLVVISISSDKDEAKWKDFVAKHEMTWVQYRDSDGAIGRNFGVQLIPSYFVVGSDGVMTTQRMGSDSDVEGRIRKLLKQAREDKLQKAVLKDSPGQISGT